MESFFLSETTKYLYLLFDTENFIHNPGNEATVHRTERRQCFLDAGRSHDIGTRSLFLNHIKLFFS